MPAKAVARPRALLAVVVLVVASVAGCDLVHLEPTTAPSVSGPTRPVVPERTLLPVATMPPVDPASGLPVVALAALPADVAGTIALIEAGGPFPFDQDGAVFENREGLLPKRERGFYREYTVPTPGSDDRGARRIVAGANGEMYWTPDHYDSFAWIDR